MCVVFSEIRAISATLKAESDKGNATAQRLCVGFGKIFDLVCVYVL